MDITMKKKYRYNRYAFMVVLLFAVLVTNAYGIIIVNGKQINQSLEGWEKIRKVEISQPATKGIVDDNHIVYRKYRKVKELDEKGSSLEREVESFQKRIDEIAKELSNLTSQRKTLIDQYNAELEKASKVKTPTPQPRKTVP